jgi:predicted GNAT family N-acyltransferase
VEAPPGVEVRIARDEAEIDAAMELRMRVFGGEQGISRSAEIDGLDPAATHVIALRRGNVVGTCRLRYPGGRGKLERMAVEPALRRTGIGSLLVTEAEAEIARHGAEEVYLHAQERFEAFYASCGYASEGETFLEEGIPHVLMRKRLGGAAGAGVDAAA